MNNVDVVPDRIKDSINYKILILIISGVLIFHFVVNSLENSDDLVYVFSICVPALLSISSFFVARRYSGTLVYSKAYIALGIAFIGLFLGELTYYLYEQIFDLDPYPSIADVFFFLFYPMTCVYLLVNIRFFSSNTNLFSKITIGFVPLSVILLYVLLTLSEEINFDFYYGVIFIVGSSVTLGISIYAARIFKEGLVGISWFILVIGLLMTVGGDTWYYYIELFEGYSLNHPVNILWYASYFLVLYSLYKHKSAI